MRDGICFQIMSNCEKRESVPSAMKMIGWVGGVNLIFQSKNITGQSGMYAFLSNNNILCLIHWFVHSIKSVMRL